MWLGGTYSLPVTTHRLCSSPGCTPGLGISVYSALSLCHRSHPRPEKPQIIYMSLYFTEKYFCSRTQVCISILEFFLSLFKSHHLKKREISFPQVFRKKKENSLERNKQGLILNQSNKQHKLITASLLFILTTAAKTKLSVPVNRNSFWLLHSWEHITVHWMLGGRKSFN